MTKSAFFGFGWLRPELAPWAILGALVFLLGLHAVRRRAKAIDALVAPRQRVKFVPRLSLGRARARFVLAALAVAFLAVAAAGPVRGFTLREIRRRGLDLVVCVDTSRSMLVRDLRPDRITRARREVKGLIDRMRGDRMALIAFAGDAREVAPLTHDRNALTSLLTGMTPAENEKGGTDIAAALERALAMFDGRTGAHEGIVLLTDGEDLEGRGLDAAKKAALRGVKVFVVGMGTEAGGKIPVERPGGGEAFLRGPDGQEVVSAMSGRGLEELASTTGGAYLSADASAAPLEELYEKRISRLEAREVQGGQEFVPHDRFQWFLGLAAACMLGAAGLRERRARAPKLRGAFVRARGGSAPTRRTARAKPAWARAFAPWFLITGLQVPPAAPSPAGPTPASPAPQVQVPGAPGTGPAMPANSEAQPSVPPYTGSARAGLEELRAALDAKELDKANALGEGLAAMPRLSDATRAEIEYHRGVVHEARGDLSASSAAFARSGGLASPGALRLDAWYDAGTVDLLAAEQLFLLIPEVREARKLPPLPQPPAPPPGPGPTGGSAASAPGAPNATGAPKDQDLDQAAAAYAQAKQGLTLRLRADWHDEDTRANLELIQRRSNALKKIREERKKQEEEKPQQDPKEDPEKKDKPKDQKDPSKQDDSKSKPDKPKDDPSEPQEKQKPDEKPKDPSQDQKPDEKNPEESQKNEKDPQAGAPKPVEPRELSKEEVSRLMDQLQQIEQEARELEARIRAHRRAAVPKDW